MTQYGNYRDKSNNLVELTQQLKEQEQQKADNLLKWQADYQKKNPKASLRNVKRSAAKHFGIKLK